MPAAMAGVFVYLWQQAWYQYLPLAVAVSAWIAVYLLKIHHRVPAIQGYHAELAALNDGKPLQVSAVLRRRLNALHDYGANHPVWRQWLVRSENTFRAWLGPQIWTFSAFLRLLIFAYVYPMLMLLTMWLLLNQGMLGEARVLPDYGPGHFCKRLVAVTLVLLPFVPVIWLVRRVRVDEVGQGAAVRMSNGKALLGVVSVLLLCLAAKYLLTNYLEYDPFASAGAGTGLVAFAFAVAVAIAIAGAFAGVFAFEVAVAVAYGLPVAFVAAFAGPFAFAIAVIVAPVCVCLATRARTELRKVLWYEASVLGWGVLVAITTPSFASVEHLAVDKAAFVLLFFYTLLPVCNAFFDWVSVAFTRECLQRYSKGGRGHALLIVADLVVAVVLTVSLYAVVLGLFYWMERLGWGIDARALIERFGANPFDPQVSWIALMALTNLLPTLFHMALWVLGCLTRAISVDREDIRACIASLTGQLKPTTPAPSLLGADGKPLLSRAAPAHVSYSKPVIDGAFNFIYVDHWMALLTVFALICAAWEPYLWLLAWCLRVFV